jgi:hypothetical protein
MRGAVTLVWPAVTAVGAGTAVPQQGSAWIVRSHGAVTRWVSQQSWGPAILPTPALGVEETAMKATKRVATNRITPT